MRYSDFIAELKNYIAEARQIRDAGATHEDGVFRRWRHGTEALVQEAAAHGYRLPGEYRSSSRLYADMYDQSQVAKVKALAKDLSDSEVELQFLVDHFGKYGQAPLHGNPISPTAAVEPMRKSSLSERVREHWLIGLTVWTVAVVGATWKIAQEVAIAPKVERLQLLQSEVEQLKSRPATPVNSLPPVQQFSINTGDGATTADGGLAIRVDAISQTGVTFVASTGSQVQKIVVPVGGRGKVATDSRDYYIDVQRLRGGIVDFAIARSGNY